MAQSQAAKLVSVLALVAAGLSGVADGARAAPKPPATSQVAQRIDEAIVAATSLHATPVDENALLHGALAGMMQTLDGQSGYIAPAEFEAMNEWSHGRQAGVGLTLDDADGVARISLLANGGAAARGGLRVGDYIVAVDGASVLGETESKLTSKLSGPPGSSVKVSIIRDMRERLDLTLVRDAIAPGTSTTRMEGDYAYLRPSNLNDGVSARTIAALETLRGEHPEMKGVVLDLRDNPGGLLDQAVAVSDIFLDSGAVFSARGQKPTDITRYVAHPGDVANGLPMVVLINGGTAAGGEIIASALQDNHRARLVGTPSFGRGSIQTVVPLRNGSDGALKVTSAYFYRPSGEAIEAVGVKPDIMAPQAAGEALDTQLTRALDLLKAGAGKPG